jgi:plastocyanin domain-containing protein
VEIAVTKEGFVPASVTASAGQSITLVFTRTAEATCATEVVIPTLKVRKELPLNKPIVIEMPPQPSGEISFACGMNMLRGALVVR